MFPISSTHIIREAREVKATATFSMAEIIFVLSHCQLSETAKLIWLWLAAKSAKDLQLSCYFSYVEMSGDLNQSYETLHIALRHTEHGLFRIKSRITTDTLANGPINV